MYTSIVIFNSTRMQDRIPKATDVENGSERTAIDGHVTPIARAYDNPMHRSGKTGLFVSNPLLKCVLPIANIRCAAIASIELRVSQKTRLPYLSVAAPASGMTMTATEKGIDCRRPMLTALYSARNNAVMMLFKGNMDP